MFFSRLRDWTAQVCTRPSARPVLYAISFSESIFFPIPVDVALAPIVAQQPRLSLPITLWTTAYSVFGALAAYGLAMLFWEAAVQPLLSAESIRQTQTIAEQLSQNGFMLVFISAISPIPFKLCALSAGVIAMPLSVFVLASALGRLLRYGLVVFLVVRFRQSWRHILRDYVEPVGLFLALIIIAYLIYHYV